MPPPRCLVYPVGMISPGTVDRLVEDGRLRKFSGGFDSPKRVLYTYVLHEIRGNPGTYAVR